MNLDPIFLDIVKGGGFSGTLIACALLYLALQVRSLHTGVEAIRETIGEKVFPTINEHTREIAELKARAEMMMKERKP